MPPITEVDPVLVDAALLRQNWAYRHFLSSRVLSSLALNGVTVAVGWLIYDQTNSAFALGLVGLVQFLPVLVLTFIVGQVADRYDRRRIGLICQLVEAVTVATMALGVWQGWLSTTGIYVGMAVLGCAIAFERPTMAALLPGIVPASMLRAPSPPRPPSCRPRSSSGRPWAGCCMVLAR